MSGNPSVNEDILQLMTAGSDGSQTTVEHIEEMLSMMKSLDQFSGPENEAMISQLEGMLATQESRDLLNSSVSMKTAMASKTAELREEYEDEMRKSSSGKARVDRLLQGLKLKALKDLARDNNVDLKGLREKREVGRGVDVVPGRARGTDVLASRSRRRSRPRAFTRRRTLELLLKGT